MSELNCLETDKYNFNIQQLTRLKEDKCYLNSQNQISAGPGNYNVTNYKDCECKAPNTFDLSLQQPVVQYKDSYGWTSTEGCNIDNDSQFRNARNLTNLKEINQLFQRPYKTVPYMGKGAGDVNSESTLRNGEDTFQNRPCNNLAGVHIDRTIPQIPCIKESIQNAIHIIPEENDCSWVRGGQPSRQIIRNADYLKKCGYKYNGKLWIR